MEVVSHLKTFTNKGCKIATQKKVCFWAGSGCYTTRIRRLYNKDQEVIQQGLGGNKASIRRLYNKDHNVIQPGSGGYNFCRDYSASQENF